MTDEIELELPSDEGFQRQVEEAQAPRVKVKIISWRGQNWSVRAKPSAKFLAMYEDEKMMKAVNALLGDEQYNRLLDLDPDLDGPDGMEGFVAQCNKAWGLNLGN